MKKIIGLILAFGLSTTVFGMEEASYVFRGGQPPELVFDQTVNILQTYEFPIKTSNRSKGYIETEYTFIKRFLPDFKLRYFIHILEIDYGIKLLVRAEIGWHERPGRKKRDEINSAWWLIKKVVRISGK